MFLSPTPLAPAAAAAPPGGGSSEIFASGTYSGTGLAQSITGVGFQPGIIAIKPLTSGQWVFVDASAGVGEYQSQAGGSGVTTGYDTDAQTVTAFGADGFSVGTSTLVNNSGTTYYFMCWIDPGSFSSNTDGSITSNVAADDDAKISICTYSGTGSAGTFGHGLSTAPDFVLAMRGDTTSNWRVYHDQMTGDQFFRWDDATSIGGSGTIWDSTAPTSSVVSIGSSSNVNNGSGSYTAFCMGTVSGKFATGMYTGTAAAGHVISGVGFQPKTLIIRRRDYARPYFLFSEHLDATNSRTDFLSWSESDAEDSMVGGVDFDADGFTLQTGDRDVNYNNGPYLWWAWSA